MSTFIKELVTRKLKNLTLEELLYQSSQYGFSISELEGQNIIHYLRHNTVDPFNRKGRTALFHDLSLMTSPKTAMEAEQLFTELIHSYGLGHLFN